MTTIKQISRALLTWSVLFSPLTPAVANQSTPAQSLAQEIETLANNEIKSTGIASIQISVGFGTTIVYEGAFGLADVENNVIASTYSKYRTASVAKWITATTTMKLAGKGLLDLDQPIQTYCPEFSPKEFPITTRQLLTHTSGVRHYLDYEKLIAAETDAQKKEALKLKSLQESLSSYTHYSDVIAPLAIFNQDALLFKPGSNWEYSSLGYRVLACVIQGATKKPYRQVMEELIFKPLGMLNTTEDDSVAIIAHRTKGYSLQSNQLVNAELRDVSENLPAGGYLSTSSDLVRFALAFNNDLVSDKTRKLMSTSVAAPLDTGTPLSWRDAIPQADKYGYGIMLLSKYQNGMIGHTGRQAGASAIVVLVPEKNISIAIMSNVKEWNGYMNLANKIIDHLKQQ